MMPDQEVPRGQGYRGKSKDVPQGALVVARVITLEEGSDEDIRKVEYDTIFENTGSLADDLFTFPVAEYHLAHGENVIIFQHPDDVEDD